MLKNFTKSQKIKFVSIVAMLLIAVTLITVTSVAYARWVATLDVSKFIEAPVDTYNPSYVHLKFQAIDENGNFVSTGSSSVHSYAVVGYDGLVSEVIIPETYKDSNGTYWSVTRIVASTNAQENFLNNRVVTSITIPKNVTFIGGGVFANMLSLRRVVFTETSVQVNIADNAFLNCTALTEFITNGRPVGGDRTKYLAHTPIETEEPIEEEEPQPPQP